MKILTGRHLATPFSWKISFTPVHWFIMVKGMIMLK